MTDTTKKLINGSMEDLQELRNRCLSFEKALQVFRKLLDVSAKQHIPGRHYPLNPSPNELNDFVPETPAELKEVAVKYIPRDFAIPLDALLKRIGMI